jgi:integrase
MPATKPAKPAKPWPGFPLFAHQNGQWAKKIKQKLYYFGPWGDPNGAYSRFLHDREALEAGRKPSMDDGTGTTVDKVVNLFLAAKRIRVDTQQMSERSWQEYLAYGKRIIHVFGRERLVSDLTPTDFEKLLKDFAQTHKSLVSISGDITKTKVFFNFALKQRLIDRPVWYGAAFTIPSKTSLRRERQQRPRRMFEADQILTLLGAAKPKMRTMILLGINCGFGNADCGLLRTEMLDLPGWVNSPRSKTAIMRHCPLWLETAQALEHVLDTRKPAKDSRYADRVFITVHGAPWLHQVGSDNPVSTAFRKLLVTTGLMAPGKNFYGLRHTHASVGKQTGDNDAVRHLLGHTIPANDMLSGVYDELPIEEHRLIAVSNYVHDWLFKQT